MFKSSSQSIKLISWKCIWKKSWNFFIAFLIMVCKVSRFLCNTFFEIWILNSLSGINAWRQKIFKKNTRHLSSIYYVSSIHFFKYAGCFFKVDLMLLDDCRVEMYDEQSRPTTKKRQKKQLWRWLDVVQKNTNQCTNKICKAKADFHHRPTTSQPLLNHFYRKIRVAQFSDYSRNAIAILKLSALPFCNFTWSFKQKSIRTASRFRINPISLNFVIKELTKTWNERR